MSNPQLDEFFWHHHLIVSRFFPSEVNALMREARDMGVRTNLDFQCHFLALANQTKLKEVRNQVESWVQHVKDELRTEVVRFIDERVNELEKNNERYCTLVITRLRARYRQLDHLRDFPGPHETYQADIEREFVTTLGWYETMAETFRTNISKFLAEKNLDTK